MRVKRTLTALAALAAATMLATGCTKEAEDVNKNLSTDADNFQVERKVLFVNGITDKVMLEIMGLCSVDLTDPARYSVTCKDAAGEYVRHFLGKSDNVTVVVQQTSAKKTSTSRYRFVLRPESLIPEVQVRTP
jgi:hypothetical protein